jgi:trimethylamine--corrinoid protein Co-methyltransferase
MDAQAAHEATYSALMTALAGANIIYGPGMLDFGITVDYGQLLFSNDIIKMVRRSLDGIDISPETLAVDIINKVGPAGNFIFEEHTMKYMYQEQAQPDLINRKMRYAWENDGKKDLTTVAKEKAVQIIEEYRPTPLKEDVREEVSAIAARAREDLLPKEE